MSLLEDRILRIIELRQAGKSHAAIASSLHLSKKSIMQYELSLKMSLEEVLQEGVSTLGEIAAQLKMTRTVTGMAMEYFGLGIPEKRAHSEEKVQTANKTYIADITRLAVEGKTRQEIAQKLSLSYSYVSLLVKKNGIAVTQAYKGRSSTLLSQRPRHKLNPSDQAVIIQTALEQGERSLEKLLQQSQSGINRFYNICKDYRITLPEDIIPYRYRPEFDVLIEKGLTLKEIGAQAVGKNGKTVSKERIRQYVNQSGQYYFWEQQRVKAKPEHRQEWEDNKDLQRHFLCLLEERIDQLAAGNFLLQKAIEYDRGRQKKVKNIPLDKLITFFQRYETAKQEGKKLSLQQLSQGIFTFAMAGRLLERMGLPPLFGNLDLPSREVTNRKKELIQRGLPTPFSTVDLEYFSGIPAGSIIQYIQREGGREPRVSPNSIKRFTSGEMNEVLTYRLASEIIEANDAGFTPEETTALLDKSKEVVDYALEHEEEISGIIVQALQTMYPGKNIERPYLLRAELPTFRDVKQEAMQRAFKQLPWNVATISYFLNLSYQQAQKYYTEQGGKITERNLKHFGKEGQLTISTASKVYELQDQGLREKTIQRRLHQSQQVVEYALQHRSTIESEIIAGLRVLFPDEKISKPYR